MSPATEQILESALALSAAEQVELIEALIAALEQADPPPLDDAWLAEIRRRSDELDAGTVTPIPWEVVRDRARSGEGPSGRQAGGQQNPGRPMQQVRSGEAITKAEFHSRLRAWVGDTEDATIGPSEVPGVTAWVHVEDDGRKFRLHADTGRQAVADYLRLVDQHGDDLKWSVVANHRGRKNAVAYGPEELRVTSFYLYLVGPA